ncbi:sodium-dependent bicarbonate transport family permease [Ferrimonas balearica]|uniref:sodium-dependent bicarbonate transport family permease n=1 Tax=Ferrimonas balearica TaxID=44012 RepID=UPI001C998AA3|nr:sodium-dependent bicarbonate transport family permease [Ferrimonas balearica]MBY5920228.1 sodium-dependent bicarbonate transport family permease [Ferrimonas balearica]MBY5997087.1 sodium-dependent bicarbonate transport family permease [Ferrimonas balearica]
MGLDIVVAFFVLGAAAQFVRAELSLPKSLYQSLVIFLLLAIGLKGGIALSKHVNPALLIEAGAILAFGFVLPLIAFPLLRSFGHLPRLDAATIAAHYGSVSVATYAVAVAFLESRGLEYEPYFPLFVALLEAPAIAVGLWLASRKGESTDGKAILREMMLNQGMVLLLGGLLIGWWGGDRAERIMPFFGELFHGVLALFLLAMGQKAAERWRELGNNASFLASFGVAMPLIGALLGTGLGYLLGFSQGGTILIATLGASASYIAVPAALSAALPKADLGPAITASLGITFPFNVLVGIPLYSALITRFIH